MQNSKKTDVALLISTEFPPQMFQKTTNIKESHAEGAESWSDWQTWSRQTDIEWTTTTAKDSVTQLQKDTPLIDFGRWLTYYLVVPWTTEDDRANFDQFRTILHHHNIPT